MLNFTVGGQRCRETLVELAGTTALGATNIEPQVYGMVNMFNDDTLIALQFNKFRNILRIASKAQVTKFIERLNQCKW